MTPNEHRHLAYGFLTGALLILLHLWGWSALSIERVAVILVGLSLLSFAASYVVQRRHDKLNSERLRPGGDNEGTGS